MPPNFFDTTAASKRSSTPNLTSSLPPGVIPPSSTAAAKKPAQPYVSPYLAQAPAPTPQDDRHHADQLRESLETDLDSLEKELASFL